MHFWNQVKEVSFSHRIIWNLSAYWYQLVDVCVLKHASAVLTLTIPAKMPHLWVKIHLMGKVFLCHVSNVWSHDMDVFCYVHNTLSLYFSYLQLSSPLSCPFAWNSHGIPPPTTWGDRWRWIQPLWGVRTDACSHSVWMSYPVMKVTRIFQ